MHQSACYRRQKDADLMNHLCRSMEAEKWFFTEAELKKRLKHAGFLVREVAPAPGWRRDLWIWEEKYGLDQTQMVAFGQDIKRLFKPSPKVFLFCEDGFIAWLYSIIFTCETV